MEAAYNAVMSAFNDEYKDDIRVIANRMYRYAFRELNIELDKNEIITWVERRKTNGSK
jgi:hypothetical protein